MSMLFFLNILGLFSAFFSYVTSSLPRNKFSAADRAHFKTPRRSDQGNRNVLGVEDKREPSCGTARASFSPAILAGGCWASTHRHPPGRPGSGWGTAMAPGGLWTRRAGNSWLCTQTAWISLLEQGELCFSQLAGIYINICGIARIIVSAEL